MVGNGPIIRGDQMILVRFLKKIIKKFEKLLVEKIFKKNSEIFEKYRKFWRKSKFSIFSKIFELFFWRFFSTKSFANFLRIFFKITVESSDFPELLDRLPPFGDAFPWGGKEWGYVFAKKGPQKDQKWPKFDFFLQIGNFLVSGLKIQLIHAGTTELF